MRLPKIEMDWKSGSVSARSLYLSVSVHDSLWKIGRCISDFVDPVS